MNLTETGEARVRGYLFILGRSLRSFLPKDTVDDALREVGGHIRERVQQASPSPDERAALERILAELGPPLQVAQAYATELTIDEAVTTGRFLPLVRALAHLAGTTFLGFFAALGVFTGYAFGLSLLALAFLKPVFPQNVGLFWRDGFKGFGALFPVPPDTQLVGGYWIVPFGLVLGLLAIVLTTRGAKRFLAFFRTRGIKRVA